MKGRIIVKNFRNKFFTGALALGLFVGGAGIATAATSTDYQQMVGNWINNDPNPMVMNTSSSSSTTPTTVDPSTTTQTSSDSTTPTATDPSTTTQVPSDSTTTTTTDPSTHTSADSTTAHNTDTSTKAPASTTPSQETVQQQTPSQPTPQKPAVPQPATKPVQPTTNQNNQYYCNDYQGHSYMDSQQHQEWHNTQSNQSVQPSSTVKNTNNIITSGHNANHNMNYDGQNHNSMGGNDMSGSHHGGHE